MRFESKDFIKSQRQWQDSRAVGKKNSREEKVFSNDSSYPDRGNHAIPPARDTESRSLKENLATDKDNDYRDDGEDSTHSSLHDKFVPSDLSKKELAQLEQSKQKQTQEQRPHVRDEMINNNPREDKIGGFDRKSVETFLAARERVKRANRNMAVEPSMDIDEMMLSILPSYVWFGDFLNESRHTISMIQRRMLLDYSREYS